MKKFLFLLFFPLMLFAQQENNYIQHKVVKGETVFQIAKKYSVSPDEIYRLNPDAKNGVQENTTILIPRPLAKPTGITHKVAPKETLFSIAKKYKVSVSDIENWNKEKLKDGLQVGQEIFVSKPVLNTKSSSKSGENPEKKASGVVKDDKVKASASTISHTVLPQETKFGIASKYGISVTELEHTNPHINECLKGGEVLLINTIPEKKETLPIKKQYEVKSKETLYSLSKKLNVSQEDLLDLNPELKEGLKEGMVLNLPSKEGSLSPKNKVDLLKTVNKSAQKELVLLLPFNINKIENDSIKSKTEHLKTNKFLNLALDFYAGALVAIDSAKVLGLPVNVKIFDVESSKFSTNMASIIAKNDFSKVDALIGPFQNSHVENTAQMLTKYNIPVISPLSKEKGLGLPNLYYAYPSEEKIKANLFTYFKQKNGNVVAIISPKKPTSKEYISSNYPEAKFAAFNEKGALDVTILKTQLIKGKPNFVILDIEKAATILSITNTLKSLQKEFDIQLVVFEVYDALNFEEIPIKNLTTLKMMYPSANKVISTPEELIFAKKFKKDNNIKPNAAAVKGFDITFDTILRICQEEGFAKSVTKSKTEYVENSFDYSNENGSNNNNAGYLMYYDNDLTIKQVK